MRDVAINEWWAADPDQCFWMEITDRGLPADAEPEDGDGARPRAADRFQVYPGQARGREANAFAEQQYIDQDLVDQPPPQAMAGHVGAKDLQVLAPRGAARRGHGVPDVTGEIRDLRVRQLRRPMSEDEHGSRKG